VINNLINILPYDGYCHYIPNFVNNKLDYFSILENEIEWQNDKLIMFGKEIITRRKVAWYGDDNLEYKYSGKIKKAIAWSKNLSSIKDIVVFATDVDFNSCLLNYYQDGADGMGWHQDNEPELEKNGTIASISFGASRKFVLKHLITKEKVEIILEDKSLLIMSGEIQDKWQHSLPKSKKVHQPRINLTFRKVLNNL